MTNEEKARELAKKYENSPFRQRKYTLERDYTLEMCIEEAMQWKDEQVVEKCKHFLDHTCFGEYYNRQGILDVTKLFDDLIKFIK